jgi:hypothetical protein
MLAHRPPRSHSVVARLQFSNRYATRHKVCHASESKSHPPPVPQGRRSTNVMLSDARDFRVGTGRCTVSWRVVCALSRAPTAGGLVRLVLRVLDWYTSCSSLNLPSAEYAGDTVRECESGNPSLAGSYESVISLIDAGQRSGYAESNACLRGITSPTSRSESSFGYVRVCGGLTGAGAVAAEPPKTSQSRRGAAVEPTLECESRKTSVGE